MAKRKRTHTKRSLASLPKGLPVRGGSDASEAVNPFEVSRHNKRPKHEVVNRRTTAQRTSTQSALARALKERETHLRQQLKESKKSNAFVDRRIGEYNPQMTAEEQQLQRLVKQRAHRSQRRLAKYNLNDEDDDEEVLLTHKGKSLDSLTAKDRVILSDDDDEDEGQLDAMDTLRHFGDATGSASAATSNPYGPSDGSGPTMAQQYTSRKTELDDLIRRRKLQKAERIQTKEAQVEAFEKMDDSFADLAAVLQFRDKGKEYHDYVKAKEAGTLSKAEVEMAEWDQQLREYQFGKAKRVKAADRTLTLEEKAQAEADRLNELETRRLARMNGEQEDDDHFSDISDDENDEKQEHHRRKQEEQNPEQLDGNPSDDESEDGPTMKFTPDGLVEVDKNGLVVRKVGNREAAKDAFNAPTFQLGDRVQACYRAKEQFDGHVAWYDGVIAKVHHAKKNGSSVTYDVDYDDGDFENDVEPQNVRPLESSQEEHGKEQAKKDQESALERKRQKATEKARTEMPYVFEVPTTLDALHELIGEYAKTGQEATVVLQRIYKSNNVRLDRRNADKMQNFYDVLLRRFTAVGDAISSAGDGGAELGRYDQLDAMTLLLYDMAQDAPDSAGAVWARRLGILQNAHAKRLRDAEMETGSDDDDASVWPSTGVLLLLRALGHVFPVTDRRHYVVLPAMLLLGQFVAHTPVYSMSELTRGVFCSGLMLEYTREAKRVVPEALAFLAGVVRLFAPRSKRHQGGSFPSLSLAVAAEEEELQNLRARVSSCKQDIPAMSLEKEGMQEESATAAAALLNATLVILERTIRTFDGSTEAAERELFSAVSEALLVLHPKDKPHPLPRKITMQVAKVASALSEVCHGDSLSKRAPMQRRGRKQRVGIKTLAPRMEHPEKYSMSKDRGKSAQQTALDRTRRELKRERKAATRELRLDAAFVEKERRTEQNKKDAAAKARRHKAFSWLETEQASMNQQVAQGGGLLSGGGMGAARAKARSGKIGVKKGEKF